ncbi:MAG TPA: lysophospholipid acyltransferase family protein [Candidatus Margulisiibacteriota bacterium]|nr:lysophospholipid acyltransferase family protein [Candidatus Margulisiibacteriota bacterium]
MRRGLYLVWVYTMIGLWTLVVFPSSLIVTLLTGSHRIGHRLHARFWGRMILWSCGVRLRVHGLEHLRRNQSYVLMINHNSHFAGYAVAAGIPLQWRAVLGIKLRKIPVFAWIGLLAGHIFIDTRRTPRAIATLNAAADKLHSGLSVLVFPEGKHHEDLALLPFRSGGFHLAVHAGIPVVPLTAVERRRPGPARSVAVLHLYVDPPIATMDRTAEDVPILVERTRAAMENRLGPPGA